MVMANPIDKLKKIKGRSWTELRMRGEQVLSAYTEQIGLSGKLPSDDEFRGLLDKAYFEQTLPSPELLKDTFYQISAQHFFTSFRETKTTVEIFRNSFEPKTVSGLIEKAQRLTEGKFDLLGYQNLNLGEGFDWHFEPVSGRHLPLKHWKQFDELDAKETGDKKVVWELNRHQHFFSLGVAYLITRDEEFALTFVNHLESWMEQNPPGLGINWVSSLEVAFRSISWIWALNFFKDSPSLTPELFQNALKFLHVHGRHIEKYLSTYYSPNTHLTGEALGLYYLGTQLPFFNRSAEWRKKGRDILMAELDRQILPDGVYFEQSTWYQRYTADFYTHFLILSALSEEDLSYEEQKKLESKLQQIIDFLMYITRPDGTTPIIGDDDGGRLLPLGGGESNDFRSVLTTAAVLLGRGDYKFVGRTFTEETLWLLGREGMKSFESMPKERPLETSVSFPDGGYYVMRDGWAETDNYLLTDCGDLGSITGGHSHADTLAFDAAIAGKTVLVDPGTYTYHESELLRDYFRSTKAHNTLDIDNESSSISGEKFNWQETASATLYSWVSNDRFDFLEGSHDGYSRLEDGPAIHHRSILFLKNDYWIIRDYVDTMGEHDYGLNFHFNHGLNPKIKSDEGCIAIGTDENESGMRLFTFGDDGEWQQKESWVSTCYGKKVNGSYLRFANSGVGSQEFFSFILPDEAGFEKPEVLETQVVGGRAFVIKYRDYSDLFVFSDGEGQMIRTEFFDTDFRFLWARLSEGEESPEEFVMADGKHFSVSGREIISRQQNIEYACARRLGAKLNVRTNEGIFSASLPQSRSHTLVLKDSEQSD